LSGYYTGVKYISIFHNYYFGIYILHKIERLLIGAWSKDKLELLKKYLLAYSKIMNKQKAKWLKACHYIDAFAEPGMHVDKEWQHHGYCA